ncbi:MAG: fatty acid desaturase [Myxococcaceae bacterium]|nr:fatty acid desaturase [Myxococcaceae bacterium]
MSAAEQFRPESVDLDAFLKDLAALGEEWRSTLGPEDLAHLKKLERWGRTATAVGALTAWVAPNPLTVMAMALGRSTRWMLMHHVGHRGYDRVPGVPARLTSQHFARGARRFIDWLEWIEPEAWKYEHNVLHHSHTGEEADPDLVERNTEWVRKLPKAARWAILGLLAGTWRTSYYAQATTRALRARDKALHPEKKQLPENLQLVLESWGPYFFIELVLLPALYLPLGPWAAFSAACNTWAAEVLTNLHTFLVIGPNHAGDDLFRFTDAPKNKAERYFRQVVGSVNYRTGGDLNDWLHMFLNYQIEHHLWPDAPMRTYQWLQPKVKALCEKHGVPYVQESVWKRFARMADVFVGNTKMQVMARPG